MSGELQQHVSASTRVDSWLLAAGILLPSKSCLKESAEVKVGRYRRRKYVSENKGAEFAIAKGKLLDNEEQLRPIDEGNRLEKGVDMLRVAVWKRIVESLTHHLLSSPNLPTYLCTAPRIALQTKLLTGNFRYFRENGIPRVKRLNKGSRLSIGTSITPVHLHTEGDSRSDSPTDDRQSRRNRALHLSQAYCLLPAIPRGSVRDNSTSLRRKATVSKASIQSPLRIKPFKSRSPKRNSNFQVLRRAF